MHRTRACQNLSVRLVYNGTPDGMGDPARLLKDLEDVVGSRCGATPEHTAVIRSVMVQ